MDICMIFIKSNIISASLGSIQPYATINAQRLVVHMFMLCKFQTQTVSRDISGHFKSEN